MPHPHPSRRRDPHHAVHKQACRLRKDSGEAFEEHLMFFRKFLAAPLKTGSVMPSSEYLTREMVKPVDWQSVRRVAELGAGTGVFTRRIAHLFQPGCEVHVFEKDDAMRLRLQGQFRYFRFHEDALHIRESLGQSDQQQQQAPLDAIISGLPFSNFPPALRHGILDEAAASLAPEGVFVTFMYTLRVLDDLKARFRSVRTTLVPLNFPPAFVHVCHGPR